MRQLTDIRPELDTFEPYSAGRSIQEIKEAYGLDTVIKLASNENPLGTSPLVQKTLERMVSSSFRYPRVGNPELNTAIANKIGVSPKRVVAGNGSDEIIDLLIRLKPRPGIDNVVAFKPCFSMYCLQAKVCGVEMRQTPLNEDFSFDFDGLVKQTDDKTALVFVTNPDNPSGHSVPVEELIDLSKRIPPQALLVVDEAYIHFADDQDALSPLKHLDELPNVVLLRTFSKAYGLAGLRLGYGVMPEWLAQKMLAIQTAFSVNILAVEAGMTALEDDTFLNETIRVVREGRSWMTSELKALGCKVWPSQTNFLMFQVDADAAEVFEKLLQAGIIVRPLTSYGLRGMIRVNMGTEHENKAFIEALSTVLKEVAANG